MKEKDTMEEIFGIPESKPTGLEDIQEKTNFYLAKLFDYFWDEEHGNPEK